MWKRRTFAIVCALALSAFLRAQQVQPGAAKTNSPDLPAGPMQQKARTACTECHDAGIIVQQRLDRKTWGKEVDKMIRWGALVDPPDRDALVDYFATNFGADKPPIDRPYAKSSQEAGSRATK
jgi:hypothetical protein